MNARLWIGGLLSLCALAACDLKKSDNPLSPQVAGPIAGVTITSPRPLEPGHGSRVVTGTDVGLVIENASTTGPRELLYEFEVSADPTFSSLVLARSDVPAGQGGRTRLGLGTTLAAGRTYHWRARAIDGANRGPYSDVVNFSVADPVVLSAPAPVSPIGNVRVATTTPLLRTANAGRSGPAGGIEYEFELADSAAFASLAASGLVFEQPGATEWFVGTPLGLSRTFFWRVRAVEATVTGPWSPIVSFQTPLSPAPAPPPPSGTGLPGVNEGTAMVAFVIADMRSRGISVAGDCGAWEITRRVAWAFRDRGAGLEYKPGGRRCQDNSIDIVLFNDGTSVDILIGAGEDNGPAWQTHPPYSGWQSFWRSPGNPDGEVEIAARSARPTGTR